MLPSAFGNRAIRIQMDAAIRIQLRDALFKEVRWLTLLWIVAWKVAQIAL